MNVTVNDIKGIEQELGLELTNQQRESILKQFQRVVMDRADNWNVIIKDLIKETDAYNSKHR